VEGGNSESSDTGNRRRDPGEGKRAEISIYRLMATEQVKAVQIWHKISELALGLTKGLTYEEIEKYVGEHLSRGNGRVAADLGRYRREWEVNREGLLTEEDLIAKAQRWEFIWGRKEGENKPITQQVDQTMLEVMKYEEGLTSYECLKKVDTKLGRERMERAMIQKEQWLRNPKGMIARCLHKLGIFSVDEKGLISEEGAKVVKSNIRQLIRRMPNMMERVRKENIIPEGEEEIREWLRNPSCPGKKKTHFPKVTKPKERGGEGKQR